MTTQNCADCGTKAEPGESFCEACGAVLSWRGTAGQRRTDDVDETPPAGTAMVASDGEPKGSTALFSPETPTIRAPRDGTTAAPEHAKAPPPEQRPEAHDTPDADAAGRPDDGDFSPQSRPDPRHVPTDAPTDAPTDTSAERARRLLIPVAEPGPGPTEPPTAVAPTLPGRPTVGRPQVKGPGAEPAAEGGTPCPWCGTPNHPGRHFCARCAMSTAREQHGPAARSPWWRRLTDRSNRETPWAGDRPHLNRSLVHLLKWTVAGLVTGLLIVAAFFIPDGVQATKDHFAKRAPVVPVSVDTSRSYPDHGPELAFDMLNNTWWGPGVSQSGEGEWIEARFEQPTDLLNVIITPGVSANASELSESALPRRLEVGVTTADGSSTTQELDLDQGAGGQLLDLRAKDVIAVRLTLVAAYAASADKQVAIAEVEFFGPSSDGLF